MIPKPTTYLISFALLAVLFWLKPAEAVNQLIPSNESSNLLPRAPEENEFLPPVELPKAPEEKEVEIDKRQQARIILSNRSLAHLEACIKRDDFFSQRVALNIWRSNAIEAGTFDKKLYKKLKHEIYQTSIEKIKDWFDAYIQQKYYYEAGICLKLWRLQTKEIDTFNEEKYIEMKKLIKSK